MYFDILTVRAYLRTLSNSGFHHNMQAAAVTTTNPTEVYSIFLKHIKEGSASYYEEEARILARKHSFPSESLEKAVSVGNKIQARQLLRDTERGNVILPETERTVWRFIQEGYIDLTKHSKALYVGSRKILSTLKKGVIWCDINLIKDFWKRNGFMPYELEGAIEIGKARREQLNREATEALERL